MSADDTSKQGPAKGPRGKKKLVLGDRPDDHRRIDRMATVLVDDDSAAESADDQAYGDDAETTQPFIDADDPTPPPSGMSADDRKLPPTGPMPDDRDAPPLADGPSDDYLAADEPTPPPTGAGQNPPTAQAPSSAHDAEHITSTGFIPSETFKMPAVEGPQKKKRGGPSKFSLPSFVWLDDGELPQRLAYGGGGLLAGAFAGGLLGIANAFLQGWSLAQGAGQIMALAAIVGLFFAAMAAMKPSRVDHLLDRLGLGDD